MAFARPGEGGWQPRLAGEAAFLLVLFGVWATLSGPAGDVADHYTDHLRHVGEAAAFLSNGFSIYSLPYTEATRGIPMPCQAHADLWGQLPAPYPPFGIAVFTPFLLLEQRGIAGHALPVAFLVGVAGMAVLLWLRLCAGAHPVARVGLCLIVVPLILGAGLNGFFDVVFVLGAVAAAQLMIHERPGAALVVLAVTAGLHFRAVVFVPLAVLCIRMLWTEPRSWRPVGLAFVLACLLIPTVVSGALLDTSQFPRDNPLRHAGWREAVLYGSALLALVPLLRRRRFLTAATLVAGAVLMRVDFQHCWWHAIVLVAPALTLPVEGRAEEVGWPEWSAIWMFAIAAGFAAYTHPWSPYWEWVRMVGARWA